ncbi:MAG: prepilin-type N-terminal cleavage/methylation domain-containing protein [Proteobacteria bacterium]|nr:MAG: prepilin-type N-terminal cleavage/methylation domain-containing protein [Pseudomonadota bacterium]QKK10494.1 MAG: prepilin-type N-terminal cleavage/methylation domain-containing protein [Pseudomonadota bacterium]
MNVPLSAQRGLSLIELVIAIVVIGIAVTGIVAAFSKVSSSSVDPMLQEQAIAIAEAYLEEISLRPFVDPDTATVCPAPEAARSLYDNICDYNGLSDVGARDQTGTAIASLSQFTVTVAVVNAALNGVPAADSLRIDVRVNHSSGHGVSTYLSGYRTRE